MNSNTNNLTLFIISADYDNVGFMILSMILNIKVQFETILCFPFLGIRP